MDDKKELAKYLAIFLIGVLAGCVLWTTCGHIISKDCKSGGLQAEGIADNFRELGAGQQAISAQVEGAKMSVGDVSERIERSEKSIKDAQHTAGDIDQLVEKSGREIERGRSLVQELLAGAGEN